MLFLLPPSETKKIGGKPLNIGQVALIRFMQRSKPFVKATRMSLPKS
jgi:hypothetical protein